MSRSSTFHRIATELADPERLLEAIERRREELPSDPEIKTARPVDDRASSPLRPVSRERKLPLSFAQERLWLLHQIDTVGPAYHLAFGLRLSGDVDVAALRSSLNQMVMRHEVLRTSFPSRDGRPSQVVAPPVAWLLPTVDLTILGMPDRARQSDYWMPVVAGARFDLSQGALRRACLFKLDAAQHLLLVCVHHIVSDGWSMGILIREVAAVYRSLSRGEMPHLTPLKIQYADYAAWQRESLQAEALQAHAAYWRQALAGLPPALDLPTDRPRPAIRSYRGGRVLTRLPRELGDRFESLVQENPGTTLFMILLAGFGALVHRVTGCRDFAVGSPIANRDHVETEGLIGFFVNTVVLRLDLQRITAPSFRELLGVVRESALGAYAHRDLPFERLVEELRLERSLAHTPLFQIMFALQNTPAGKIRVSGLTLTPTAVTTGAAKFDLALNLSETEHGLTAAWEYSQDLFDATTIQRLAGHLRTLLAAAVRQPRRSLHELPLLRPVEHQQLLLEWNDTSSRKLPGGGLLRAFNARVECAPDAVALAIGDRQWSCRELDRQANRLANYLVELGAGPETRVGIYVARSVEMVVGILGILKAGAAYVPLDLSFPAQRLAFMLRDACGESPLLVSTRDLDGTWAASGAVTVHLDSDRPAILRRSARQPRTAARPENLAYVLFTSGSTGQPKGVAISHRSLLEFLLSMARNPGLGARDVLLSVTTVSFDIFALELFLPLLSGARLELASREVAADPIRLRRCLSRSRATVMQATPVTWKLLLTSGWRGDRQLTALCGGEALPGELAVRLMPRTAKLWNLYGPTEATVWASVQRLNPERLAAARTMDPRALAESARRPMAIGRPVKGTRIHLADPWLELTGAGIPGELVIAGVQLARGYLRKPRLTAHSFVPDPWGRRPGERLYKTGDVAGSLWDGTLEFRGRQDAQVKIRGFRIELGEIEAQLMHHPQVSQAGAVVRPGAGGELQIVAYLVPKGSGKPSPVGLREFLETKLPAYMLPSAFVTLARLPVTPNEKVDRGALGRLEHPAPGSEERSVTGASRLPRTETERAIAEIVQQVLEIERLGVNDNFFELGGNSALMVEMNSKLRQRFQRDLLVVDLFTYSTIRSLARHLEASDGPPAPDVQDSRREQVRAGRHRQLRRLRQARRSPVRD